MDPVRDAIHDHLAADSTLTALLGDGAEGIHHRKAHRGARTPMVIFNRQAGTPTWTFGGIGFESGVWLIKAVSRDNSASTVEDIAARLDLILNDAAITISGQSLLLLRRESDVDYGEQDGADSYQHRGGLYRLITETA